MDFTGRDGVLAGDLPAGLTADDLITRLEAIDGVRVVRAEFGGSGSSGASTGGDASPSAEVSREPSADASSEPSAAATGPEAKAAALPSATASASEGKIALTGTVPSQAEADALVDAAAARFGDGNVTNQLTIDPGVSAEGLPALAGLLGALGPNDTVTAALSGGSLDLSGSVSSEATLTAVQNAANEVTANVTSSLTVSGAAGSGSNGSGQSGAQAEVQAQLDALPQITFYSGGTALTPQGMDAVRQASEILKKNPDALVRVQGYTDDVGEAAPNLALSTARAKAVRATLHTLGIAHERMSYVGFGETRPLVPNTSEANRQKNRRVQFEVL